MKPIAAAMGENLIADAFGQNLTDLINFLIAPAWLSRREKQLVDLLARSGFRNKAIGHLMGLTEGSVKTYENRLYRKLGISGRMELVALEVCRLEGLADRLKAEVGRLKAAERPAA